MGVWGAWWVFWVCWMLCVTRAGDEGKCVFGVCWVCFDTSVAVCCKSVRRGRWPFKSDNPPSLCVEVGGGAGGGALGCCPQGSGGAFFLILNKPYASPPPQ